VQTAASHAPVRVLVVDDHELFRLGLERALAKEPGIEVVGEAADGEAALERVAALRPDVVLMDVRMPGTDGIEATRRIRETDPDVRVLVLAGSHADADVFAAVRAGAHGYLLKEATVEEVAGAVRDVARGLGPISPVVGAKLLAEFNSLSRRVAEHEGQVPRLTARELDVLRLVARGMANREIAEALVISGNTVRNHVRSILEKLRVRSRIEAAMVAVRDGLVEIPPSP
jgi:DNA-binding NarL/FixJ family response regulator